MWIYSGRRGVHCWVVDEHARKLTSQARTAIVEYLTIVKVFIKFDLIELIILIKTIIKAKEIIVLVDFFQIAIIVEILRLELIPPKLKSSSF